MHYRLTIRSSSMTCAVGLLLAGCAAPGRDRAPVEMAALPEGFRGSAVEFAKLRKAAARAAAPELDRQLSYSVYFRAFSPDVGEFVFMPREPGVFDGEVHVGVDLKHSRITHTPDVDWSVTRTAPRPDDVARLLAETVVVEEEPSPDVSKMTLREIALREAKGDLDVNCPYNVKYSDITPEEGKPRVCITFRPVNFDDRHSVRVDFYVKVERKESTEDGPIEKLDKQDDDADEESEP